MMEYSTASTDETTESGFYAGLTNSERDNLVSFINQAYGNMSSFTSESSEEKMKLAKEYIEETRKTISIGIRKVAH
jgi:hypothetical protein